MKRELVFRALAFAERAHRGQFRKGTELPYLIHPLNAAAILIEAGCEDEVIAAALLHDTLEDTRTTAADLAAEFGPEVTAFVEAVSQSDKSRSWEERKESTVASLRSMNERCLLVEIADKLDNIRTIHRDYITHKERLWNRFKRSMADQCWYYRALLEIFQERLACTPHENLLRDFRQEVEAVFGREEKPIPPSRGRRAEG
ncbi:MAG: HD domain-containing protein [Candidatus Eremiobacteraeota bacterium]|nr:HD domain-containing protein [Candidatus Eremiobacteraeota bacterium]